MMPNNRVERTAAMRLDCYADGLQTAVVAVASALPRLSLTQVVSREKCCSIAVISQLSAR